MRLDDMEQEFPKMPETMRAMVEKEVEKQIKTTEIGTHTKKSGNWTVRRAVVAALVATMALGTTVAAGVKLYQINSEPVGDYGLVTKIENQENTEKDREADNTTSLEIPLVTMEAGYIPEGMIRCEEGIYSYEETPYEGGFSVGFFRMDTGDDAFEVLDTDVMSSEQITLGGHDGVYLVKQSYDGEAGMQHIYLSYPEVHYVLDLYIFPDVTKEEALKFAEGIKLNVTEDEVAAKELRITDWSQYTAPQQEEVGMEEAWTRVSKEEFQKNLHQIGDSFAIDKYGLLDCPGLKMKVSDVEITEDMTTLFSPEQMEEDMKSRVDAEGKLLPVKKDYVTYGDGINSTTEVVKSTEVPQKFVYATVEYTNEGTEELKDVLFYGTLLTLQEQGNEMTFYTGETSAAEDAWNDILCEPHVGGEMAYYDVHSGERDNNYIPSIKPGETVSIHVGFYVTEDMLPYLYLNMDSFGYYTEFSDTALEMGYIDIRK